MQEFLASAPGVYSQETDQTFTAPPANPGGLAVVGPTQKGAAFVPTDITSFGQYKAVFGLDSSDSYTPQTAFAYLQAGNNVSVTRVFVKVIISLDTRKEDVLKAAKLVAAVDPEITLILQPNHLDMKKGIIEKCLGHQKSCAKILKDVRIIPQVHKFMKLR